MIPNESCVTAPKKRFKARKPCFSMFRERERRSRCAKSLVRGDSDRPVLVGDP